MHEALPELAQRFNSPAYYEIGWGDRDFYQAQEVTSGLTLQALFWSKGAVLHVVALFEHPEQHFAGEPVVSTCLSRNELISLQSFLVSVFPAQLLIPSLRLAREIMVIVRFIVGKDITIF